MTSGGDGNVDYASSDGTESVQVSTTTYSGGRKRKKVATVIALAERSNALCK